MSTKLWVVNSTHIIKKYINILFDDNFFNSKKSCTFALEIKKQLKLILYV